jgi:hypothetical protein
MPTSADVKPRLPREIDGPESRYPKICELFRTLVELNITTTRLRDWLNSRLQRWTTTLGPQPGTIDYQEPPEFSWPAVDGARSATPSRCSIALAPPSTTRSTGSTISGG